MKLAVLGLGCWGLVLLDMLTNNFDEVVGWSREEDLSDELKNGSWFWRGENLGNLSKYSPGPTTLEDILKIFGSLFAL